MPRNVSSGFKAAVFGPETSDVIAVLLTIEHNELAEPIRLCSDSKNLVSQGKTFLAYPFYLMLPTDKDDEPPRARIAIDNVARDLVVAIRSINSPATVTMQLVRVTNPSVIEAQWSNLQIIDIRYDALVIEADISLENYLLEPYPKDIFNPAEFPGLFM